MVGVTPLKLLFTGSLMYMCIALGDASSFAKITAIASQVVQENMPYSANAAFRSENQLTRFKREIVKKTLDDPKGCIRDCRDNQTALFITATVGNMARLLSVALKEVKGDEVSSPEKEAAFKQRIKDKTIANMGPLFEDLCAISNQTDVCYEQCPDSQLRTLIIIDNAGTAALCEPSKNWNNFTDYWNALNCTNSTQSEAPCDNKCGHETSIGNVTHLSLDDSKSPDVQLTDDVQLTHDVQLTYETDVKKNTAAVGPACKSISCEIDCYKPIMTERCGQKAYDMYSRLNKMEPRTSLRMLKTLKAVEDNSDCKAFQ